MPLNENDRQQIRQMIAEQVAPIAIQRVELEQIKAATCALQSEVSHLTAAVTENGRQIVELQQENSRTNERIERGFAELRQADERINERMEAGFAELRQADERINQRMEAGFAAMDRRIASLTEANEQTNKRMEAGFAAVDRQIAALTERMEAGFASVDRQIAALTERMEAGFARVDRQIAALTERMEAGYTNMNRQIGALTEAYGLDLEDVGAYVVPHYLEHEEGLQVGPLVAHHLTLDGEQVEIDLFGEARRGEQRFTVVAEVKSRVHIGEIRALIQRNRLIARQLQGGETELLAVLFPRRIYHEARRLATEADIRLIPWDYPYRMT